MTKQSVFEVQVTCFVSPSSQHTAEDLHKCRKSGLPWNKLHEQGGINSLTETDLTQAYSQVSSSVLAAHASIHNQVRRRQTSQLAFNGHVYRHNGVFLISGVTDGETKLHMQVKAYIECQS